MDIQKHSQPEQLEKYSFLWSEVRLVIAALALLLGGVPPVLLFNPIPGLYGIVRLLLTLSWIISGVAAAYLLYRWNAGNRMLFGGKKSYDTYAFFVMVVSGLNLGITGLLGTNIGMTISSNRFIFTLVALIYLASVGYLHQRWTVSGKKIF